MSAPKARTTFGEEEIDRSLSGVLEATLDAMVALGILFVLLVEGMFESEIALPFHQSCVVLWMMGAIIAASVAYERRVHEGVPEAAPTIPRFSDPVVQAYG